jgi:hypothetical protein
VPVEEKIVLVKILIGVQEIFVLRAQKHQIDADLAL